MTATNITRQSGTASKNDFNKPANNNISSNRRIWRPLDGGISDCDLEDICQNDLCDRYDLHETHDVIDSKAKAKKRGWKKDPFEKQNYTTVKIDTTTNKQAGRNTLKENIKEVIKPPWLRGSPKGLDNAISLAISSTKIKIVSEIYREVLNTFGPIDSRSVYRRLGKLVTRGCAIRVSFDHDGHIPIYSKRPVGINNGVVQKEAPLGMLSGYLRPKSKLFKEPGLVKDLLWEASCGQGSVYLRGKDKPKTICETVSENICEPVLDKNP